MPTQERPFLLKPGSGSGRESRQQKARECKAPSRTQSEQDERGDKLSLSLASAREEARGQPHAAHLMYLKA